MRKRVVTRIVCCVLSRYGRLGRSARGIKRKGGGRDARGLAGCLSPRGLETAETFCFRARDSPRRPRERTVVVVDKNVVLVRVGSASFRKRESARTGTRESAPTTLEATDHSISRGVFPAKTVEFTGP